jgi:hypothetical protein
MIFKIRITVMLSTSNEKNPCFLQEKNILNECHVFFVLHIYLRQKNISNRDNMRRFFNDLSHKKEHQKIRRFFFLSEYMVHLLHPEMLRSMIEEQKKKVKMESWRSNR